MSAIQQLIKQITDLNNQKEYQQVRDILTEKELEENENAELYYQAALACENLDEYDDAGDYYEKAFTLDTTMAWAYAGAGRVYDAFGENDDAIKMFNAAIKLDPANAEYYYLMGDLKGHIAKAHKEAISDLNKAIKLDPQYAKAFQRRGELLFLNKEYEEAKKDFTKAIELQKDLTTAYVLRGLIWHQKKTTIKL
jgi:tetratricopeptide (TPR) repeat protein